MSDEPEIRYLGDVQRLHLEPGDVIVVTVAWKMSASQKQRISEIITQAAPGHWVLVLDEGVKVGVMGPGKGTPLASRQQCPSKVAVTSPTCHQMMTGRPVGGGVTAMSWNFIAGRVGWVMAQNILSVLG